MLQHDAHVFDYVLDWIETERKMELLAESLDMGKEYKDVMVFVNPFDMVGAWDE